MCGGKVSVLEKFHCQVFTNILSSQNCQIFGYQSFEKIEWFKQLVFSMIIFTDMSFHNQLYKDFISINFEGKNKNTLSDNEMKVIIFL